MLTGLVAHEAQAAAALCPTQNLDPAHCGPITTKIVLPGGGTLAFFNIPANKDRGTPAVNAAYFSPDGFNLEGNGGATVPAYVGPLKIQAIVAVNGGVDTLFEGGSVYFSPNGQNLGGGCTGAICTVTAYSASAGAPITQIVAAGGGVDAVLATVGGHERAYFSPDGLNLGGGGSSVVIYDGGVGIAQIVSVDSSAVVTLFSSGAAYYSPNNRNIGGGGSTISAYRGPNSIQQILKIGGAVVTEFVGNAVYLSPNGQNLGGGGATVGVASWVHASEGPFPVRDSPHGAVFNGRLYLSGGFFNSDPANPQIPYASLNYFDLWGTNADESGTTWNTSPLEECNSDVPIDALSLPPCWDAFSALVVWNSQLWVLGSSVFSSADGATWTLRASANGGTATPAQTAPDENAARAVVLGGSIYYIQPEPYVDVQTTSNPNGTPWTDLGTPPGIQPRCGAAIFASSGKLWIEGGKDAVPNCDATSDYTHDIWSSSDGVTWTKAAKTPDWPQRQWPCVTTDQSGTTWLVGGYSADFATSSQAAVRFGTNLADVWYTKDGLNWKQFKTDIGSRLPDDLALGVEPRHAPVCFVDAVNNRLVVVAGKVTRQSEPNPPYSHDSGDVSNDVRILPLPDPAVLP